MLCYALKRLSHALVYLCVVVDCRVEESVLRFVFFICRKFDTEWIKKNKQTKINGNAWLSVGTKYFSGFLNSYFFLLRNTFLLMLRSN